MIPPEEQIAIELTETRDALKTNLDGLLARSEQLDTLDLTTNEVHFKAQEFREAAEELHTEMRWRLRRPWVILGVALLLIALGVGIYILYVACDDSFDLVTCFGGTDSSTAPAPAPEHNSTTSDEPF